MRAYFFTNMYLSDIQKGIQTAHVIHDMFIKYNSTQQPTTEKEMLYDWANNHKTIIILNGGYQSSLNELSQFFESENSMYPWAHFHEEEAALNGALTCVGTVLDEKIYLANKLWIPTAKAFDDDAFDLDLGYITRRVHKSELYDDVAADDMSDKNFITLNYSPWDLELIDRLSQYKLA